MRKLSSVILADLVTSKRKEKSMTQQSLAEATGINRALISRIEKQDFIPSIPQLEQLGEVLGFEPDSVFADTAHDRLPSPSPLRIAVAGTGYVGLSIATLLAQHNHVTAVDILPEKVDLINRRKSPIQDDYIEKYLAEKDLDLTATLDGAAAYRDADYVIIAAPTNYDSARNYFDTSAVEAVIELVLSVNPDAVMVIKSTIPVGYTESVRQKYHTANIIFSPEFLRESKALYDNLYPSRIIVSTDSDDERLVELADKILTAWRGYTDESCFVYAETDGEPHNTITPIARMRDGKFQLDLVLRNNITTPEHPLGVYHPHAKLHHIKKENIGLIEVMGLAVLPSRLKAEMTDVEAALVAHTPAAEYGENIQKHAEWAMDILARHPELNAENVHTIVQDEIGHVFAEVLVDAGVYKMDTAGRAGFERFLASI